MSLHVATKQTWADEELVQVGELLDICNAYEDLSMKLDLTMLRSRSGNETNDFLYYADGKLVGLLALSNYGTEDRELTGMVHPDYRRRGIFTTLLLAAKEEARERGISRLILICERFSRSGQAFLATTGAQYDFSEHKMVVLNFKEKGAFQQQFQLQKATLADVDAMARIVSASFGGSEEGAREHILAGMKKGYAQYYIGKLGEEVIGSLDFHLGDKEYTIYGFGILPEYRGQGLGRQMLEQLIKSIPAENQKRIALEVNTSNTRAINLYRSCGFQEITTYGYYNLDI
jgi:ribosomal protein S18 acetylase RimI-like enzyme